MILDLGTMEFHEIPLPDLGILSSITNLLWLNDGDHLAVGINQCRSEGVGSCLYDIYKAVVIDMQSKEIRDLPDMPEYSGAPVSFSADGKLLCRIDSFYNGNNWDNWLVCFNLSTLSRISIPRIPFTEANLSGPILWSPYIESYVTTENIPD
jgi:hypothetical protein